MIVSSALYFVLYTIILMLIYSFFNYRANERIASAFTTMADILIYEEELIQERYAEIPMKHAQNTSFIVFDSVGNIRYASDQNIGTKIFFDDLNLLDNYHSGKIYDVFEKKDSDGHTEYWVCLGEYGGLADPTKLTDYCLLNEELKIMEGDLFPGRTYLSEREFDLLNGVLSKNSMVEQYEYKTESGEDRILVFWSQNLTEKQYDKILDSSYMILALGIPVIGIAIIVFAVLFSGRIKRQIEPLNQIIRSYESGNLTEMPVENVYMEFSRTVSAFQELIQQVETERIQKEEMYAGKQKLIADISHDIKTPLTVIQGYAKALTDHMVPKGKEQQYLQTIYRKSEIATEMVNDLFLMTKMEHPDYIMDQSKVDFFEFTKELLAERYMEIAESGFDLVVDIPDETCMMWMDLKLMERCFQNLLGNALKYNIAGTTLFLKMSQDDTSCTMIVADDGIGIPDDISGTIFEPFVTGNEARTTGKGTGLGLSIVQKIVSMHRGKIELVIPPEEPYKTEFRFVFPKNTEM